MKRIFVLLLTVIMLLECSCGAVPQNILSSDDVVLTSATGNSPSTIYATEYAYVRGNDWKDKNWRDILAERGLGEMLIIKNGHKVSSSTRHTFLRFDLSSISSDDLKKVELALNFTKIQTDTDVPFKVFLVSNDWKENEITYSNQPAKIDSTPIASDVIFKNETADVTSAIKTALRQGDRCVTLMISQTIETVSETQIEFSKLKAEEMPRLIISTGTSAGSDPSTSGIDSMGRLYASEYAYVRGNDWKDKNWRDILEERGLGEMLIIKNGHKVSSSTRHTYLKFDISGLTTENVSKAELAIKFTKIQSDTEVPFKVFLVSNVWDDGMITYSSQPAKLNSTPIADDVILNTTTADVTSALYTMIQKGEKEMTLMILQSVETVSETQIEFSKLGDGEMPHLIITAGSGNATDTPTDTPKEDLPMRSFYATEYAYVRGGKYSKKNWRTINAEENLADGLHIKNGLWKNDVARRALFKFDLSGLNVLEVGFAELSLTFTAIQKSPAVHFDVYLVDDNWTSGKVTWDTQPKKLNETPVIANAVLNSFAAVDVTEFVEDMLFDGKTNFSIMLVQIDETEGVTTIDTSSPTASTMPHFKVYKENQISAGRTFVKQLVNDEAENKAIWDRAKQMYDEWYVRYEKMKAKPLGNASLIQSDMSEFTKTVMSPGNNPSKEFTEQPTRTLDALKGFSASTDAKFDVYGGIVDNALRQKATGFFYTTKINGRWWVIDPLGYPCVLRSMSGVTVAYKNSPTQKNAILEKFGTPERWAISTTRHLKDDLLFNCEMTSDSVLRSVEGGLSYFKRFSPMIGYGTANGLNATTGGQARFSENNTMPVFNPDFETYVDDMAKTNVVPDDKNMIAYITDNELPMDLTMLRDFLTVDPYKKINRYSYACAWYWITEMTGKEYITDQDLTSEMMDLFRGFVWDRYYHVVKNAIEKYDTNHLYAGTKYLHAVKESEWVLRVSGEYLDILTINWYAAWEPQAEFIYDFARYAGIPFMVTEFYAKSSDTFDNLASKDGAGFYVNTQEDRGLFYQNFTLRMLEAKNCVGWQWFQYTDNDPKANATDTTSRDSNKGIVNNKHEEYTALTDDMVQINKNVYKLIEYFDAKYGK